LALARAGRNGYSKTYSINNSTIKMNLKEGRDNVHLNISVSQTVSIQAMEYF
jgi:hypothetical protein